MMKRNKRYLLIAFLSLLLLLPYGAKLTGAYFSDRDEAKGSNSIKLGQTVTITEEVDSEGNKDVTLNNTGDTPVVVRVAVFANAAYIEEPAGENWVNGGDGYYYYKKVLAPGESTSVLEVNLKKENIPNYHFEIVIIEEAERVTYNGDSVARPDGWAYIGY